MKLTTMLKKFHIKWFKKCFFYISFSQKQVKFVDILN